MRYLSIALAMLAMAGCSTKTSNPDTAEVSGQVLYIERIAVPSHPLGELPAAFSGTLP